MNNSLALKNTVCVVDAPIGSVWQSKPVRANFWRLLWFAVASSDWSRTHVNPFTAFLYRSNLGGITFCIDFVLAMTKAGVNQLFGLGEETEIIASGYDSVVFRRPVRLGTKFFCRFTLKEKTVYLGKTWYKWKLEVVGVDDGKIFCFGIFKAGFFPVKRSSLGNVLAKLPSPYTQITCSITALAVAFFVGLGVYHKITKPTWQQFLVGLEPQARNFYLAYDTHLIERIQRTGEVRDLAKVCTFQSAVEMWGEGP